MHATVHGRILRETTDTAAVQAEIRYQALDDNNDEADSGVAYADATGAYRFEASWQGPDEVALSLEIRARACRIRFELVFDAKEAIRLKHGAELELDFTLEAGRSVELVVEDAAGAPLAGAKTAVILHSVASCGWPLRGYLARAAEPGATNAEGRVTWHGLRAPPYGADRYVISVAHARHAEALIDIAELDFVEGVATHRVRLEPGHVMRGRITDGVSPIANAAIVAWHVDPSAPPCHGIRQSATSDEDGQYRLIGLRPGEHYVTIEHPDFLPLRRDDFALNADGIDTMFDATLITGRLVSGTVRDSGEAVADAEVIAECLSPNYFTRSTTTKEDGSFRIAGVPEGELDVYVNVAPPDDAGERGYDMRGYRHVGANDACGDFELSDVARLAGVLTHDAKPIGMRVLTIAVNQPGGSATGGDWHEDRGGRFELDLPPGTVDVYFAGIDARTAEHFAARRTFTLEARERRDVLIEALPTIDLVVQVVDAESDKPISGAGVQASAQLLGPNAHRGTSDDKGRAVLEHVPQNELLNVVVAAPGYQRRWIQPVTLPRDQPVIARLDPKVEVEGASA